MDRRDALVVLGRTLCGAAVSGLLPLGCAGDSSDLLLELPLDELPEGERVVVEAGDHPIELLRSGDVVRARSLWCTHTGCVVHWDRGESSYLCPCHDGRFDAEGKPTGGPPTEPLRSLPVEVAAATVRIPR